MLFSPDTQMILLLLSFFGFVRSVAEPVIQVKVSGVTSYIFYYVFVLVSISRWGFADAHFLMSGTTAACR